MMKEKIIGLMERTLSAYPDSHIQGYFDDVKLKGLTEHGFPRLTANIGILISHGRRTDLKPLFLEMMEFCCKNIPIVRAANDFSVREICSSISELEQSGAVAASDIERWKGYLGKIDPTTCYNKYAKSPTDKVNNWALFTALSEFFRMTMGLGGSPEYIDTQIATQLSRLDENGMYMDGDGDTYHPILYDIAARGLFALLLKAGYRGKYYREIDDALRRAGIATLKMQSPNGEIAFGGRSNQFLHNEPWMAGIFAYEASRYKSEGNLSLSSRFSSAMGRALAVTEAYLNMGEIRHTKNRFPTSTKYGCESYAYFNKYMITTASNLYAGYLLCDDKMPDTQGAEDESVAFSTSPHFHKLFLKAGGYGLEFDLNGDPHYDASGLGRVHRAGAPADICLSVPCPSNPSFAVNVDKPRAASLCPGVQVDGKWIFATDRQYRILKTRKDECSASAVLCTDLENGERIISEYRVDSSGVAIEVSANCDTAFMLPAFHFDGEAYTEIRQSESRLEVVYKGWICRYTVTGTVVGTGDLAAGRNGNYKIYFAARANTLGIKIEILNDKN